MGMIIPFVAFGVAVGSILLLGVRWKRNYDRQVKAESAHPSKAA